MRVECPNCSTTYEVPAVHFVDGVRRLRCTQCGYRWNQSASDADLNDSKKSTPLLDMLEPAMNMEASAAVHVDIVDDGDTANTNAARTFAAELDPQSADDAFDDIDDALAPLPAPTVQEELDAAGRRWQWGLGLVTLTILVSALILGREAVVNAAPVTQPIYRAAGLEPWSALRRWDLCVTKLDAAEMRYTLTNRSTFRRTVPGLYISAASGDLMPGGGAVGLVARRRNGPWASAEPRDRACKTNRLVAVKPARSVRRARLHGLLASGRSPAMRRASRLLPARKGHRCRQSRHRL